jgi:hypothetical protein
VTRSNCYNIFVTNVTLEHETIDRVRIIRKQTHNVFRESTDGQDTENGIRHGCESARSRFEAGYRVVVVVVVVVVAAEEVVVVVVVAAAEEAVLLVAAAAVVTQTDV